MKIRKAKKKDLKYIAKILMKESAKKPYDEKYTMKIAMKEVTGFLKGECYISIDNNEVVGFLTDGINLYEIRAFSGKIVLRSGKLSVNEVSLINLIRTVVSLEQSALSSENLIRDFCGRSYDGVLFDVARILNSILIKKSTLKIYFNSKENYFLSSSRMSAVLRMERRKIDNASVSFSF